MRTINLPLTDEAYQHVLSYQGKMKEKKVSSHVTLPQTVGRIILEHKAFSEQQERKEKERVPNIDGNNT